ncbi:MAG: RRXRR domain-containing protein [Clostridium sp.]
MNSTSRLRHRKARWNNRVKSKKKGWLAPSLKHKLDTDITINAKILIVKTKIRKTKY